MDFRLRPRRSFALALLAIFLISTGSTPARAAGIGDYVAPFQSLVSVFENVFAEIIALLDPHKAVPVAITPATSSTWHASGATASAAAFNSVAAFQPQDPAVPIAPAPKSPKPVVAVSRPIAPGVVLRTSTIDGVVTQSQLQTAIEQASNALRQLIYANAGTVGQGQYSTGGYTNNLALSTKIDQLSGTTLTNVVVNGVSGLTAANIPDLSSQYLPLSGGTITGGLTVTGSFSGGTLSLNISSTTNLLATNATTTSLFAQTASLGSLTLISPLSAANGGTGNSTPPTFGNILVGNGLGGYTLTATSSLGFPATDGAKSITDFGARCDGSTDDLAAFTAAMAWVSARGHGTIVIPPSAQACMLSAAINVPSGLTLQASPGTATLKPTPGNAASVLLLSASGVSNVMLYGVTFDGGGASFSNSNPLTQLFQSTNVIFDHVTWQHSAGMALNGSRLNESGVENSTLTDIGNLWKTTLARADRHQGVSFCCGIPGTWGLDNFVTNTYFQDIGLDAISVGSGTRFIASNNHFDLEDNQRSLVSSGDYPGAIYTTQSTNVSLTGNVVSGAQGNAFDLPGLTNSIISGNTITRSGSAGIGLFLGTDDTTNVSNVTVSGNTLTDNVQWGAPSPFQAGITLYKGSPKNVTIEGNVATDDQTTSTQSYGLEVSNYSGNSTTPINLWIDQSNSFKGNAIAGLSNTTYSQVRGNLGVGTTSPFALLSLQANSGDSNTTLFTIASSTGAAATTLFSITSAGRVGIGTASPQSPLSLQSSNAYSITFLSAGGSLKTFLGQTIGNGDWATNSLAGDFVFRSVGNSFLFTTDNGATTQLTIKNGGNVGIGSTTPASLLSVAGDTYLTGGLGVGLQNTSAGTLLTSGNGTFGGVLALNGITGTTTIASGQGFTIGGTQLAVQKSSGRVGIGTASPNNLLTLNGSSAFAIGFQNAGNQKTFLGQTIANGDWTTNSLANDFVFRSVGNSFLFTTDNGATTQLTIKNGGNVGIGTTTPASLLSVAGDAYLIGGLGVGLQNTSAGTLQTSGNGTIGGVLAVNGTTGTTTIASGQGFTIGGTQLAVQQSSGRVGIGTSSPSFQLAVSVGSGGGIGVDAASGQSNIELSQAGSVNGGLNAQGGGGDDLVVFAKRFLKLGNNANGPIGFSNSDVEFYTGQTLRGIIDSNGNLGIGTSTPYSRLSVWGSDTASSTLAFNVVNNASTTVFAVFDGGNAQLSGTLTQSSDARLKTNIQSLDASTSLAAINSLTPVAYDWIDPNKGGIRQYGFIAQQVQQVFPNLVSTTSATALTPDGTLGLNYLGLIAPLVEAVQTLSAELTSLTARVSSLEAVVAGFAQRFTTNEADVGKLCFTDQTGQTCLTKSQIDVLLSGKPSVQISAPTPPTISGTTTPPSIKIQGNNPATINVGDTYTDLGAIVHDNQGHDLSYRTFINGVLSGNILIDTSQVATDTIDYVATDTWGNTSTSTRTVIIEAATSSPSI